MLEKTFEGMNHTNDAIHNSVFILMETAYRAAKRGELSTQDSIEFAELEVQEFVQSKIDLWKNALHSLGNYEI